MDENISSTAGGRVPIAALLASFITFLGSVFPVLKRYKSVFFDVVNAGNFPMKIFNFGYLIVLKQNS